MTTQVTNWAGNVTFAPNRVHRPSSVDEIRELVAEASHVRALGTGHSFNQLAGSGGGSGGGDLLTVDRLPPAIDVDAQSATVTVAAGVRYGELARRLYTEGYALPNLASLPHISVAGACATATHGSGVGNGNLATAVRSLRLVTGEGELLHLDRDDPRFAGAVVGLGALGVVTSLTLDLVPFFEIRQYVYEDLPASRLDGQLPEILASAYSVSLFTDWSGPRINQVWLKRRVGEHGSRQPEQSWLDATLADGPRHPVPGMPVANCTAQLGVPGPWHERLPHFRLEYTPSSGEELQSEYFVARADAPAALAALDRIRDRIAPLLQVSEIRTVAADELWLSPAYQRDSLAVHFTWIKDEAGVSALLPAVEEALAPFAPRPHWGKLFTMDAAELASRYDRMAEFRRLRAALDPVGRFANPFVDSYLDT